ELGDLPGTLAKDRFLGGQDAADDHRRIVPMATGATPGPRRRPRRPARAPAPPTGQLRPGPAARPGTSSVPHGERRMTAAVRGPRRRARAPLRRRLARGTRRARG